MNNTLKNPLLKQDTGTILHHQDKAITCLSIYTTTDIPTAPTRVPRPHKPARWVENFVCLTLVVNILVYILYSAVSRPVALVPNSERHFRASIQYMDFLHRLHLDRHERF